MPGGHPLFHAALNRPNGGVGQSELPPAISGFFSTTTLGVSDCGRGDGEPGGSTAGGRGAGGSWLDTGGACVVTCGATGAGWKPAAAGVGETGAVGFAGSEVAAGAGVPSVGGVGRDGL